jgi:hypothetical protein
MTFSFYRKVVKAPGLIPACCKNPCRNHSRKGSPSGTRCREVFDPVLDEERNPSSQNPTQERDDEPAEDQNNQSQLGDFFQRRHTAAPYEKKETGLAAWKMKNPPE